MFGLTKDFTMPSVVLALALSISLLVECTDIHGNAIMDTTFKKERGKFHLTTRGYNKGLSVPARSINITNNLNITPRNNVFRQKIKTLKETACKVELESGCIKKFRHIVYYSEANFVYLKLVPNAGVNITGSKLIVGENLWVWTFYGKEGGLEILNWPIEFGIWSMGLLSSYVMKEPMTMELSHVSGNCSNLKVGERSSDEAISNALVNLTTIMLPFGEKYGPSFYCYKSRVYIDPHFVYMLCKHIVCPIEAIKYNCCSYFYNTTLQDREVSCREQEFKYDPVNWILPTVVSILLFGFCPIFILYVGHLVADEGRGHLKGTLHNVIENTRDESISTTERLVLLDEHHHVTLSKTLCLPMKNCSFNAYSKASVPCQIIFSRVWRIILPFLSLVIIGLQVCLDYWYLYSFVETSIKKGVPLGFRSVLAGYKESKLNFLPYLGGPFVAVGIYIFITSALLVIPASVSELLLKGLQINNVDETYSPLCMRLRSIEMFGSISIRRRHGYFKMYSVFMAQFFMLLNSKFWMHVVNVQYDRWKKYSCSKLCLLFIPVYIIVCIIEIAFCVIIYGYPVISFALMIIKAYCGKLWNPNANRKFPLRIFIFVFTVVLIVSVMYFLFMFGTIFMDACLFLTRVVVFTFTGIVIYPKVSYGYLIFTFTVFYYIWESIQEYSNVYQRLLKDTIATCESLQRANDSEKLVMRSGDYKAIKESLFEHVIENHFPRRKQVFLSVLKVGVILTILGLSINVLSETDGFRELHVIMHVGTALFVCALPQILKSMCRDHGAKFKQKRFRRELADTITSYTGYRSVDSSDSDLD
ncbi:uncharacterized protein LOC123566120 [Mercenaria mercenaria]|uniref:uncharacterized protein LOC123566120 n=1 Tax=Mercenaria mercenaria TaxID=6596 RepID=UPI00234E5D60|nr:uncharacterized protein LOC123566120 [Mercenaria mercenaria]